MAHVIDVSFTETPRISTNNVKNRIKRFFRKVRNSITRMSRKAFNRIRKMWFKIPRSMRMALSYAAIFTASFLGWMTFYVTIIIAFSISLLLGTCVLFIWGAILGLIYSAL